MHTNGPEDPVDERGRRGGECRSLREEAGVSLNALARRLHRSPSSLSRFERGESIPRDLDAVVDGYQALRRRATPDRRAPCETQHQTQQPPIRKWVLAWAIGRWATLAAAEFIAGRSDDGLLAADEVRVFVAISAAGLVAVAAACIGSRRGWNRRTVGLRELAPATLLAAASVARLGTLRISMVLAVGAMIWIELGYLAWANGYYQGGRQ